MLKYRVIGGRAILGHKPGTEFEADLKPSHEARLVKLGHIEVVVEKPKATKDPVSSKDQPKEEENLDG